MKSRTAAENAAEGSSGPADGERAYHHGDLRAVLIATAEALLLERGVKGFTLRECARRAGVSPSAPAHHFGNTAGLLEAIATLGFTELSAEMRRTAEAGPQDHASRLTAMARAYIRLALRRPGRFRVTFQGPTRPAEANDPHLKAAADTAFDLVCAEIQAITGKSPALAETVFVWSLVHGLANLLLDQRLSSLDAAAAGDIEEPAALPAQVVALLGAWMATLETARDAASRVSPGDDFTAAKADSGR